MSGAVGQTLVIARRSIRTVARQPATIFPALFFPLTFAALNTAAMGRSTSLPGFPPVDSFLDFMLATTVLQGVLFSSTIGGTDMAIDIEGGFFDRLLTSPVARPAILLGRLGGSAVLGMLQAVFFIVVLRLFGAEVAGGLAGTVALVMVAGLLAVALGGLGVAIALRTGSAEAVQASFPIFFVSLFFSSAFFPRALMSGWFETVARFNPMSVVVESMRSLVIAEFSVTESLTAIAVVAAIGVASTSLAAAALRWRVAGAGA